jgi:urease accessory protein
MGRSVPNGAGVARMAMLVATLTMVAAEPAQAHHMMGGQTPATFLEGLLSGLGHPIIGIDHLAFIIAMGVAVGVAGLSLAIPFLFIGTAAIGVALHATGTALPMAEPLVALSVLVAGAAIAAAKPLRSWMWFALFAVAGMFHGYAFGESIYGAERTPLAAYLLGLVMVQGVLATAIALVARRSHAEALRPRLAGAAIAGAGIAILATQLVPG